MGVEDRIRSILAPNGRVLLPWILLSELILLPSIAEGMQ